MSNNTESANSEPLKRDDGAEAVTSIPDSSGIEDAVSPLLHVVISEPSKSKMRMNLTTMRISPISSVGFFMLQTLKLAAIPSPSSSLLSVFKPLSKTFLYCHSHTPRPQVPLFFVKGFLASAVQASVAIAPKATSPDENGVKLQWKVIDFKWIRENMDAVASIVFRTLVFHCNVDSSGNVSLEIVKDGWSLAPTITKVLLVIRSIFTKPDPYNLLVPTSPICTRQLKLNTMNWLLRGQCDSPMPASA